jgi:hypothetical protein
MACPGPIVIPNSAQGARVACNGATQSSHLHDAVSSARVDYDERDRAIGLRVRAKPSAPTSAKMAYRRVRRRPPCDTPLSTLP